MPQTNKRSSAGSRKAPVRRKKRRVNVPAFVGLFGVLLIVLVTALVLLLHKDEPSAPPTSAGTMPAVTTTNGEGTTMSDSETTTTAASGSTADAGTATCKPDETTAATTTTAGSTTSVTTQTNAAGEVEPTYIKGILIVNKTYALPSTFAPGKLESEVQSAFNDMQKDAAKEGLNLYISSGYRSYDTQKRIYNNNVAAYGKTKTDTFSARPGNSEHQTGLAFDLNTINDAFALTPESDWVKAHAHEYGFIIRYPEGKSDITGYKYEPWHLRYLGKDDATAVHDSGLTLEEFLGITSVYPD